jgi:oligoribonuclease NrnB/cAMP/cGMP phosphodiesterase (DHH superfamily)
MTKFIEHRSVRRKATKDIIVLYHAECSDGFGAAWAAHKYFGETAEYIPVEHQYPLPEGLRNKEIYLLDFTYPREITEQLMADNKRVTAIDHHISVADVTRMTQDGVYSNEHSGAVLAWRYFFPQEPPPFLIRVIEDHDLHRFALPETKKLIDWMDLFDFEFAVFDRLARDLDDQGKLKEALKEGELILRYQMKMVERLVANTAYEVLIAGHRAGAVNTEQYHSEAATALSEKYPIGIAWRVRPHGTYVSLRSQGKVNVAELAGRFGGGGHANSAGFVVPSPQELPFKQVVDGSNND